MIGLDGSEGLSQLFQFQLELVAPNETEIKFDEILGKKVTVHIKAPGGQTRHISGICSLMAQGSRDALDTQYRAEIVPEFWFLTRKAQSRIFQSKSVPDILKSVLEGLSVTWKLKGHYEPRDYCVQYRETDFNFASRLMEEEGIFYFFQHDQNSHTMIVGDNANAHPDVPFDATATYAHLDAGGVEQDRIVEWQKVQEIRSTKFTLHDHTFEIPHKNLEATKQLTDEVQLGTVQHKLKIGNPDRLEIYDWPGQYAQRFDGVGPGREDRPSDLQKIYKDNQRTTQIRMEQEAAAAVMASGSSHLRQLTAGHRFKLTEHFNANGSYILTTVAHSAQMASNYRSGAMDWPSYTNSFTCLPSGLPYRPRRVTPKPVIQGTQTAVVVGPKGEEVYTDKYGRVKVQFHWDRQGKKDEKSSCWVRVGQSAAGKRWGGSFWPRIGQEVVVDHLEGDPDQPIIIGTVYNADQMPPYLGKGPDSEHPEENLISGIKSNTSKGGKGYNELRFYDAKGKEQVFVHAERNMDVYVENDSMERIISNRHLIVGPKPNDDKSGDQLEDIYRDKHLHVRRNQVEQIEGNLQLMVGNGQAQDGGNVDIVIAQVKKELIAGDSHLHVQGNVLEKRDGDLGTTLGGTHSEKVGGACNIQVGGARNESVGGTQSLSITMNQQEKVGMNHALEAGMEIHLKAGMNVIIEAGVQLSLVASGGFVDIGPSGVTIQGLMVLINSGGAAGSGSDSSPTNPSDPQTPQDAQQAQPTAPTKADDSVTGQKSSPD